MFILQESVKQYLSQKFRNFRRVSLPHKPLANTKLVTAANISPAEESATQSVSASVAGCHVDSFAYDKNSQTLLQVWDDESYDYVFQLLKVTHTLRRQIINKSNKPILAIKDEHPYFGDNQYVSVLYSTLIYLTACC